MLVEAGNAVLSAFAREQSAHALRSLQALGVEVRLGQAVAVIDRKESSPAASANVIWSAGTQARAAATWVGAEAARNKALIVAPDCSTPGHPEIFAIGTSPATGPLPGLAPVVKQQGRYVAKIIAARIEGEPAPLPFRYRNWVSMAVIGRSRAIADFSWLRLQGYLAWLSWSLVYLFLLVSFRSRLAVYLNWSWAWFT